VVLTGADRKTMIKNAIKRMGPCARLLLGSFRDMKFKSWFLWGNFGFWSHIL